jgi:hypothetical protein
VDQPGSLNPSREGSRQSPFAEDYGFDPGSTNSDLRCLLTGLGFVERVRGSRHIFARAGVEEILNLQPKGAKAKPYQVKQVRQIIVRYHLAEVIDGEEE